MTGAGTGKPEVKVFSRTGAKVSSFLAGDAKATGGVRVGVADTDNDGKMEIAAYSPVVRSLIGTPTLVGGPSASPVTLINPPMPWMRKS